MIILALTGRYWLPPLLNRLSGLTLDPERLGALVSLFNLVFIPLAFLVALLAWLFPRKPPEEKPLSPLQACTAEELLKMYIPKDYQIPWVERPLPDLKDLKANRRLILVGARKVGKTRAAIELASRTESGLLPAGRLFDLDPRPFKDVAADKLCRALQKGLGARRAMLVMIDDLPHNFKGEALERLTAGLEALEECADLYVIATARRESLEETYQTWLKEQRFAEWTMAPFDSDHIARLVDSASSAYGLKLTDSARRVFVEISDGTPELTLLGLHRLKAGKEGRT